MKRFTITNLESGVDILEIPTNKYNFLLIENNSGHTINVYKDNSLNITSLINTVRSYSINTILIDPHINIYYIKRSGGAQLEDIVILTFLVDNPFIYGKSEPVRYSRSLFLSINHLSKISNFEFESPLMNVKNIEKIDIHFEVSIPAIVKIIILERADNIGTGLEFDIAKEKQFRITTMCLRHHYTYYPSFNFLNLIIISTENISASGNFIFVAYKTLY